MLKYQDQPIIRQRYVIRTDSTNIKHLPQSNIYLMVKVKDFCGAVFHPEEYESHLRHNIQHLEQIPMSKTFKTSEMLASGKLFQEQEAFFYIYRQIYLNHTSFGILAQINIEDYHNNKIKKHQKTLNRPGLNHQTYIEEHVGPVVVSHRQNEELDQMIQTVIESDLFSEWTTHDGRHHTLWKVTQTQAALSQKFTKIECLYVLDGHHRLEAAHQNYLLKEAKTETDLWIQAIIYSSQYIMIHPQHRVLENIPQNIQIINELMKLNHLDITELVIQDIKTFKINQELFNYEIILKFHQKYYGINFKNHSRNILERISTFRLQNQIFLEFLGEENLKKLKLKYIPGITQSLEILKYQIIFFVKEPAIETLYQIADQSVTMPPKSTWIEPKPCSHMVIRIVN